MTAYQKLKAENKLLKQEIIELVKNESYIKVSEIKNKYQFLVEQEKQIFHGNTKRGDGIIHQIVGSDNKETVPVKGGATMDDFKDMMKVLSQSSKPTKDKLFLIMMNGYTFKNDGEFLYIELEDNSWQKINPEKFKLNYTIEYIK